METLMTSIRTNYYDTMNVVEYSTFENVDIYESEEDLAEREDFAILDELLSHLALKERNIIEMCFGIGKDEKPINEIALEYNESYDNIVIIIRATLNKLKSDKGLQRARRKYAR